MSDSNVTRFPGSSNRIHNLAEVADSELNLWCSEMLEQGIHPLHLVGILQYNMQVIMSWMGDDE